MPRKRRDSDGKVDLHTVKTERGTGESPEGQLMVAMQPGAVEVPVECPALGVEEVVVVTENADGTSAADQSHYAYGHSVDQVATVAAVEEVQDDTYAAIPTSRPVFKTERSDNREVAEFLAATGSGRPIGHSYGAPRKQIKLEVRDEPDTGSDSAEETSDSDDADELPRKSPKKRDFAHRLQWRNSDMLEAMKAVEDKKMTIRGAAKKYGVPYSTLKDRVHGRVRHGTKPGVKTVLSPEEEEELVRYIKDMESAGFQMKHIDVRDRAGELLRLNHGHNSPYKDCSPGHNWMSGFMKRHPGLEFRRTCHRPSIPSLSKQKQMLRRFYDLANHVFKKNRLFQRPDRIFVVSEIRFGQYNEHTLLVCSSAEGDVLPPFVIFRGQRIKQMNAARQEFPEAFFTCTFDGQVNEDIFLWWFRDHFLKKIAQSGYRQSALYLSRNISDITIQLVQLAKEEKIHLLGIPLGVAHLLQPFDEELSKHIAGMIERRIKKYEEENNVHMVPFKGIAHILHKVWKKAIASEEIVRKFAANGLFPLNVSAISNERIINGAAQLKENQQKMVTPSPNNSALSGLSLLSALSSHEYASLEHLCSSQDNLNQSFDQESSTSDKTPSEYSTPKTKTVMSLLEEEAEQMVSRETENLGHVTSKPSVKTEKVTEQESLLMKTLLKEQEELKQQAKAKQRQSSSGINLLERKTDIREIAAASSNVDQINRAIDSILEKNNKASIAGSSTVTSTNPRVVTVAAHSPAPKKQAPIKIYKVSLVRKDKNTPVRLPKSTGSYIQASKGTIKIAPAPREESVEEEVVEELVEEMMIQDEAGQPAETVTVQLPQQGQTSEMYSTQTSTQVPQQEFQLIQKVQAQLPEEILQSENPEDLVHTEIVKSEPSVASAEQLGIHVNVDQSEVVQLGQGSVVETVVSGQGSVVETVVSGVEYVTECGDVIPQPIYAEEGSQLAAQQLPETWTQVVDENGQVIHIVQQVNSQDSVVTEEVVQGGYIVQEGGQEYIVDLPVSMDGTVPQVVWEEQVSQAPADS